MANLSKVGECHLFPAVSKVHNFHPPHTLSEILGWESCLFLYLAKTSTALLSRGTSWNLQVSAISLRQLPTCHRCTRQEQWEGESHGLVWTWRLGLHPKYPTFVPASVRENQRSAMGRGEGCRSYLQFTRYFESAIISRAVDRMLPDY